MRASGHDLRDIQVSKNGYTLLIHWFLVNFIDILQYALVAGTSEGPGLQSSPDLKTWNCMFMLSYKGLYRQDTQFNLHPYWNKIEYLHAMTND